MSKPSPRKIVIMGATSGIGLEAARQLAAQGWMVGAAGRKTEVLDSLHREFPSNIATAQIDVNSPDAPARLRHLIAGMGGMDIYFHVAGIYSCDPSADPAREQAVVQTNVGGFTRMIDAAWQWFVQNAASSNKARGAQAGRNSAHVGGHIAAITSVAGTNSIAQLNAYCSSKAYQQRYLRGLDQLSRSRGLNIRLSDIRPGWIRTPLLDPDSRYPMCMTLPYATRLILRALKRRRRVAVVDWRWNILVGLWRLLPNPLWIRLTIPISSPR